MENYAYQFIHEEEVFKMKFDVVVGNPPYQIEDGGASRSATPIYQLFVNQAFRLKPRYVSMIIPSRWFAGGKGLDDFRAQMLESTNFRSLVDFPNAATLFPSVEIKGGVCFFLWDEKFDGPCHVRTIQENGQESSSTRFLGEHGDVFIRFNEALPILEKVRKKSKKFVDTIVAPRKPFGMPTNFNLFANKQTSKTVEIYANGGKFLVDTKHITNNEQWVSKWKVLTSNGYGAGEGYPHQILGVPIVAGPGSCCTETYIVCGVFESEIEARNYCNYMRTKFFRFLVALRKNTQHVTQSRFKFVPLLDFNESWNDERLYKYFGIDKSEIAFIDSIVREMPKADD
jgi:site-specific DNA-methyltransferase (adenine-specific)